MRGIAHMVPPSNKFKSTFKYFDHSKGMNRDQFTTIRASSRRVVSVARGLRKSGLWWAGDATMRGASL